MDSIDCSGQQPKKHTGNSTNGTAQISSQRPDSIYPSKPDVVYAQIDPGPEPVLGTSDLYANVPSKNDSGDVVYSDLHSTDIAANSVATPGDLYAQVQKRR